MEARRDVCVSWSPVAPPSARQVFAPGQASWLDPTYCGSFTCRVWQFGRWVEVTIDDRLPCLAGRLCFSRCQREDVFWLPLLEKVYAKYAAGGWGARPGQDTLVSPEGLETGPGLALTRPGTAALRLSPWLPSLVPSTPFPCPHSKAGVQRSPPERGCVSFLSSALARKMFPSVRFPPSGAGGLCRLRGGGRRHGGVRPRLAWPVEASPSAGPEPKGCALCSDTSLTGSGKGLLATSV